MMPWTQEQREAEDARRRHALKRYQVWDCGLGCWVPHTETDNLADLEWVLDWNHNYVVPDCHEWHINHVWVVVLKSKGHRREVEHEALRVAEITKCLIGNKQARRLNE